MRDAFDDWKKDSGSHTNALPSIPPGPFGMAGPEKEIKDWLDFSLLPSYEKVAKIFPFYCVRRRCDSGRADAEIVRAGAARAKKL